MEDQDGAVKEVALSAQMPQGSENGHVREPRTNLEARALADEGGAWVRSLQIESDELRPLYLQQTEQPYFWTPVENGGGYLRMNTLFNGEEQSMSAFFDEESKPLPDGSLQYLVVDLRPNSGGDMSLFSDIFKWLPDKVADDGHLYIVVGTQTLSGGIVAAAMLDHYGGENSSILGMPMGDYEQFWSERGLAFRLPNSEFQITYATGFQDWVNGCDEHTYYFPQFLKHGVKVDSLTPDPIIEPTYAEYAAGRDVVMEWIYDQEQS